MATESEQLQTKSQAIINVLIAQRNIALDQCAAMAGELAVRDVDLKAVSDELDVMRADLEKLKAIQNKLEDDQP